jgi:hypothetical protein
LRSPIPDWKCLLHNQCLSLYDSHTDLLADDFGCGEGEISSGLIKYFNEY